MLACDKNRWRSQMEQYPELSNLAILLSKNRDFLQNGQYTKMPETVWPPAS
jgi:hypothetical protein